VVGGAYNKDDSPILDKIASQTMIDDPFRCMGIEGRQDIIKEERVRGRVYGASEGDSRLLTTAMEFSGK